jgi:hypothetical protein
VQEKASPTAAIAFFVCAMVLGCSSTKPTTTTRVDAEVDSLADARVASAHRGSATACPTDRPPGPGGLPAGSCTKDADCTAGKNGRCLVDIGGKVSCSYDECVADTDCGTGVCDCRNKQNREANTCIKGNCRTDGDCKGQSCSPSGVHVDPYCTGGIPIGSYGWFCHTAADECLDDTDCKALDFGACVLDTDVVHWKCRALSCVL